MDRKSYFLRHSWVVRENDRQLEQKAWMASLSFVGWVPVSRIAQESRMELCRQPLRTRAHDLWTPTPGT
jgi:hypothetical protein